MADGASIGPRSGTVKRRAFGGVRLPTLGATGRVHARFLGERAGRRVRVVGARQDDPGTQHERVRRVRMSMVASAYLAGMAAPGPTERSAHTCATW
jgi:hypothetical protein